MAVALEFLNLVIPIKKIEQHYRGGWERTWTTTNTSSEGASGSMITCYEMAQRTPRI